MTSSTSPVAGSSEQKTVNLIISLLWAIMCALSLVVTSLTDEWASTDYVTKPITFLLTLPALWGIYVWRQYTLQEVLTSRIEVASNDTPKQRTLPALPFSFTPDVSPTAQLTWLVQHLASICLMLLILATIRPIPLAGLIASFLLLAEFNMSAALWFSLNNRPSPDAPTSATTTNAATTNIPTSEIKTVQKAATAAPQSNSANATPITLAANSERTVDQEEQLEEEYQTLLALREQMEQTSPADEAELKATPRQTIHDFRDSAGVGTMSGETSVPLPTDGRVVVVTLAFVPPFPSTPEILADCEDERVDSVRVLQCQPLGAKIEVKLNANLDSDDTDDVTLLWEAMLEKM